MPVSWVSLEAGIMYTLSLDQVRNLFLRARPWVWPLLTWPISTQSWSSWDRSKMQASLYPSLPLPPETHNIYAQSSLRLGGGCSARAGALGVQIHPCHPFLPIHLLHKGKRLQQHMPPSATSLCSCLHPSPVALQDCPMCDAAGEASAHSGSTMLLLKCRNTSECLLGNQTPWILFNFYFVFV